MIKVIVRGTPQQPNVVKTNHNAPKGDCGCCGKKKSAAQELKPAEDSAE